jgi:hypothetical protein
MEIRSERLLRRVSESLCLGHNLREKENDQREEGDKVRRFDRRAVGEAWDQPGGGAGRKRAGRAVKDLSAMC